MEQGLIFTLGIIIIINLTMIFFFKALQHYIAGLNYYQEQSAWLITINQLIIVWGVCACACVRVCARACVYVYSPMNSFLFCGFFTFNQPAPVVFLCPRKQSQNSSLNILIYLANSAVLVQPTRVGHPTPDLS